MKSYNDYRNEALSEAIRYATAAKEHPDRAEVYIAQARKELQKAASINRMVRKA